MFNFNKKPAYAEFDNVMDSMPEAVSEGLVRRDAFFHSCWLLLKSKRPDLFTEMDEVELTISGYNITPDEPEKTKNPDEPERQTL